MHDNSYCDDNDRGIMGLETIKLTNNTYQISIPVNSTPIPVIFYIKIYWKYISIKCFVYIIRKSHVDATHITSTLFYKYLLPLNEQNKELSKVLYYFDINFKRNISSMSYHKLLKKGFYGY